MSTGNALEFSNVVKRYGRRRALDGLSLRIPSGSVFGLVGSNGAGKTTCMGVAMGLLTFNSGQVDLLGEGPFDASRHAGRVSLLPQDTELPPTARVFQLLEYYARLQGLPRPQSQRQIRALLEWVHLADRIHKPVRTLSHGMKRRVMIAQAFLGDPQLILLDEPLSGLDPREIVNIRSMLAERRGRQTIVISSHNLHEVERLCDHVAFIEQGKRVHQDSMTAVTAREHTLAILLEDTELAVDRLAERMPECALEFVVVKDHDGAWGRLSIRYPSTMSAGEVTGLVLPLLLEARLRILEIRRGSGLEQAYLSHR